MKKKILILNGPNLNMLGLREKKYYGNLRLKDIYKNIKNISNNYKFIFFQSNSEASIINYIHKHLSYDAYIFNLGAFTHTSIAIRDAISLINKLKIEVHLSNIYEREDFRKVNYIKDICDKSFVGLKENSYYEAVKYAIEKLK